MRRFDEGVGAVGGGLGGAAGTAALDPGGVAKGVVLFAGRDRFQRAAAAVEVEEVEVGEAAADVVAVAVVGGGGLAELGEAVEEVRRVGAEEVEVGLEVRRSPSSAWGKAFAARCWTAGSAPSSSAVSLAKPGRRTVRRRFLKTGTAFESTGRNSARKGARSLVAVFEVSISGSTSSRAARRLTKVVLAWRKVGGSSCRVWLEGDVLAGDRAEGGVGVGDRAGELLAAFGDRGARACPS